MSKSDDGGEQAEQSSAAGRRHSEEELLADLRRVAREGTGTVSERQYADAGEYGVTTFRRRFGSWNAAKRQAGLRTRDPERIDDEELLADLRRVAESAQGAVTEREYADRGRFGVTTFRRRFGSWNAAKRQAGLETERRERTTASMADDVARVAADADAEYVTPDLYAERGDYPLSVLPTDDAFWNELRDRIGLAVLPLQRKVVSESDGAR
ncbi:MAG: homing endonuclease associated repeat-containing protein [Haloferacaceae archaeon]